MAKKDTRSIVQKLKDRGRDLDAAVDKQVTGKAGAKSGVGRMQKAKQAPKVKKPPR